MPLRLEVPGDADGVRVDAFVARSVPGLSRREAKEMLRAGAVRRAGRRLSPATSVHGGDVLEVELPTPLGNVPPAIVLYEDAEFLYLRKPAGMHTVRLRTDDPATLADVARSYDPACAEASPDPREAGALQRLDRDTSGVVVFARTPAAWARGRDALGTAWKLYLARSSRCASSWPPPASDHVQHLEDPPRWPPQAALPRPTRPGVQTRWALAATGPRGHRVCANPSGQQATSRIWPADASGSLFAVELLTGRRHQVRVHMAQLGLPLLGDPLYGDPNGSDGVGLCLHAWAQQLGPDGPVVVADPPPWCRGAGR